MGKTVFRFELFLEEGNAVTWLKHHREPWEDVLHHWKFTFNLRQEATVVKVSDLMVTWPVLADPRANSLVCSNITFDFFIICQALSETF